MTKTVVSMPGTGPVAGAAGPGRPVARAKRLLYFNGFNSAIPEDLSDNQKILGVEGFARREGFLFQPCTINYRFARERSAEIIRQLAEKVPDEGGQVIFSGSSMGGWFARVMQLLLHGHRPGLKAEALAFNPAFDLTLHGHMLVGSQENFVTGEEYEWTPGDSHSLGQLERDVDYDSPLPFYVYVDKGDEVIDWQASAARHAAIARFHAFDGGSHSFEHVREALEDFVAGRAAAPD
jgi:predicted esterase YcpF (UPF0227 family)